MREKLYPAEGGSASGGNFQLYNFKNCDFLAVLYFIILALVILGPLLKPGYVFLLDFVLVPKLHFNFSDYLSGQGLLSALPFSFIIYLLSSIIPTLIIQKIIFFFLFFFSGLAMWRVLPAKLGILPRLVASTFFVINPFVYERFTAGHIGVLLGYVLLPLVIQAIFRVFEKKTWRQAAWAVFLWTLQIIFSAHFLVITGVCAGIIFLVYAAIIFKDSIRFTRHASGKNFFSVSTNVERLKKFFPLAHGVTFRRILQLSSVFLKIIFLLLIFNSFWLVPAFLLRQNPTQEFSNSHFTAYQSSPDQHYGLLTNLIGMYGFWRERTSEGEFVLAKDHLPVWPLFYVVFLMPIFFGIYYLWKEKKCVYLSSLLIMAVVGVILSVGPQSGFVGSINQFLFSHLPAFRGLRESQKFLSVLVLVYSIFMAYGLRWLFSVFFKKYKLIYYFVIIMTFANIFIYTYPLLWAANNQVIAQPYQASFQRAKEIFDQDKSDYQILVLPWHMYVIGHSLTPKYTIIDPARSYFYPHKVLISQDEEMAYVKNIPPQQTVVKNLQSSTSSIMWSLFLRDAKVRYIFVTKVSDVKKHGFDYSVFLQDKNFRKIVEDNYAVLFVNH